MTYTLTLTAEQAQTLSEACEVLGRLGMGQLLDAIGYLPAERYDREGLTADLATIETLIARHHVSAGIANAPPVSQAAWDLYQVIRHRLAWDALEQDQPTDCVSFRAPMRFGPQPLASIERVEE